MKYLAYDGRKFENLDCCERYNSELKEKHSMDNVDTIYLLSEEEYMHYKTEIPFIPTWWWLRLPGIGSSGNAIVRDDGSVFDYEYEGSGIHGSSGVRPALNLEHLKSKIYGAHYKLVNGTFPRRFTWAGVTWRTLEKDKVAIAETPIFFSKFDDNSYNYESSFIRKKLLQWYNFRVSNHFVVQEVIGD